MTGEPAVDAVVLTMNDRPVEFPKALESLLRQRGVDLRVVVVGNGCVPEQVPPGVVTVATAENLGIPQGRNVGADELRGHRPPGDFVFFFDNDAILPTDDVLARLVAEFDRHPDAAYVQPRIVDHDGVTTLRRWVPRLRAGDPDRAGTVTVMAEGVVLVRRADFDRVGGWPGHFFLFHEGIDLAWRLQDLGRTGWYAPDVLVRHPATDPARHANYYRLSARNRVWLAYRNLPAPLIPLHLLTWTLLTLLRFRSRAALTPSLAGLREGMAGRRGQERRPMRWRTVLRLTLAGRPPVV